jgi:hypothetical protein
MENQEQTVTLKDLELWYTKQEELRKLKEEEMALRLRITKQYFPTPKEGTNSHELGDGYVMKMKHNIDRKVDEAALSTLKDKLKEAGIRVDDLIIYKPELSVKQYRPYELDTSEEGKKRLNLIDQCLIVKPGAPALEIVKPKRT